MDMLNCLHVQCFWDISCICGNAIPVLKDPYLKWLLLQLCTALYCRIKIIYKLRILLSWHLKLWCKSQEKMGDDFVLIRVAWLFCTRYRPGGHPSDRGQFTRMHILSTSIDITISALRCGKWVVWYTIPREDHCCVPWPCQYRRQCVRSPYRHL